MYVSMYYSFSFNQIPPNNDVCYVYGDGFSRMIKPMCSTTIELRRSYAVAAITLWPVIAENYGAVARNCEIFTVTAHMCVVANVVFLHSKITTIATPQLRVVTLEI